MTSRDEARTKQFKNLGRHEEMRRRRAEGSVELRKQKKEDQLMKRRNVDTTAAESDTDDGTPKSPEIQNGALPPPDGTGTSKLPVLAFDTCVEIFKRALAGDDGLSKEEFFGALGSVRRYLSKNDSIPIDRVIKNGLIKPLVMCLADEDPKIQFEAAWSLTNVVSGTTMQTQAVVGQDAIPALVSLLGSKELYVAEQAAWALSNIIGEGSNYRDLVISKGLIPPLMGLLKKNISMEFTRTIAWIFSNLCRHKEPRVDHAALKLFVPVLADMLQSQDQVILSDALWALSYATDGSNDDIQLVLEAGALPRVVELLGRNERGFTAPSIRVLGNFATGTDAQTQAVVEAGVLGTAIRQQLESGPPNSVKECLWLVSNILAGTEKQIQAVVDAGLLPVIAAHLEKGEMRIRCESVWCLSNLTVGGSEPQIDALIKAGALPPLASVLGVQDPKITMVTLRALENIFNYAYCAGINEDVSLVFEECGGLDKLESLQQHENEDIYTIACSIIEKYFPDEGEDEGEDIAGKENVSPPAIAKFDDAQVPQDTLYQF